MAEEHHILAGAGYIGSYIGGLVRRCIVNYQYTDLHLRLIEYASYALTEITSVSIAGHDHVNGRIYVDRVRHVILSSLLTSQHEDD
jgi:hypothetical protein